LATSAARRRQQAVQSGCEVIEATGFEPTLKRIAELFPSYDIEVKPIEAEG
jgi:hypothetical protein